MMNSQTTVEDNNNNNSSSSILYPLAYKKKRYNAPFRIGISSCIIFREHNLQSKNAIKYFKNATVVMVI
eukprot:m.128216 g.128216  ORF g.128216 m.128216 type:complete len:69 (+) comp14559_c0_seq3:338-544(+)